MLGLVLMLVVAQAPAPAGAPAKAGVAVLVVRDEGLSPIESRALSEKLSRALEAANVPLAMSADDARARLGRRGPKSCKGKPVCLAELGRALGVGAVVTLDAGKLFEDVPVRVRVLDARDGSQLLERSNTVAVEQMTALDGFFRDVAHEVPRALAPLPAFAPPKVVARPPVKRPEPAPQVEVTPPPDAPRVAVLEPRPSSKPEMVIAGAAPAPLGPTLTGGAAVVSGLAAVTFAVLGTVTASRLGHVEQRDGLQVSTLTYDEYKRTQRTAQTQFIVAGALAGVAAALGLTTLALGPGQPSK